MREAAWGCEWVGTPVPFVRSLSFIINMANKEILLTAGKFVPVSKATLLNVRFYRRRVQKPMERLSKSLYQSVRLYTQKTRGILEGYLLNLTLRSVNSICIYRVSQEECARLRESVPYVKVYRYNPKYLYPKLNGYGDNGQRKVRSFCGSMYCTCSADALRVHQNAQSAKLNQYFNTAGYPCAM